MCGIVGVLSREVCGVKRQTVSQMNSVLTHRGPDGQGIFESYHGVLGHSRLAIIDSQHGHQPMLSQDGRYALVFNGEIYNYIELRAKLAKEGVNFVSFSDTEVLLQLLIKYGEKAIKHLNGMFAFCFLDTFSGDWIIARDHFGIKPLYFWAEPDGKSIYFSSEIKAFKVIPTFQARVDQRGISQYLTFQFCLESQTLFDNVKKLKPGTYMQGSGATIRSEVEYWSPSYHVDTEHTEAYFSEKLEYLLHDSLKLQVRSDVPLGAYLSGGLDSSTVAVYAADILKRGLPVFTGRFGEGLSYDESHHAKAVSDQINGDMHLITPTADDFVNFLPDIIYALDEPLAGPGVFPQFVVSREASKHVKVVLGGQGGDEIFGGYARYLVAYLEHSLKQAVYGGQEANGIPLAKLSENLRLLEQYKPMLSKFWQNGLFDDSASRYFSLVDRSPDLQTILSKDMLTNVNKQSNFEDFLSVFNASGSESYLNQMSYFDMKTLLPALLHVEDRVSMAASIESRVPLLDYRIVDLVNTMPASMKYQAGKTKSMLNKTVENKLPKQITQRRDKMGFPVPLDIWMEKGVVRDFVLDTLHSQSCLQRGIFSKHALQNVVCMSGVGARQLWGMLSLELWHQQYID